MKKLSIADKLDRLVELSDVFMVEQMFPRTMLKQFYGEYSNGEVLSDSYNCHYYQLGNKILFMCDKDENVFLPGASWKYKLDDFIFLGSCKHDDILAKVIFNKLVGNYHGKTLCEVFGNKPFVWEMRLYKNRKVEDLTFRTDSDGKYIYLTYETDEDDAEDCIAVLCVKGFRFINSHGYHEVPYEKLIEM